jgi:anthranilate/para-aminobenzoate synthase component I
MRNLLALATHLLHQGEEIALLYSGLRTGYSGRFSYLAWEPVECVTGHSLALLEALETQAVTPLPHWFGTIAYEAAGELMDIPATSPAFVVMPRVRFIRYRHVIRVDHDLRTMHYDGDGVPPDIMETEHVAPPAVASLTALMPRDAYLAHAQDALAQIHAGSVYQVNLTRKYSGLFTKTLQPAGAAALFHRLHQASPAPYSALIAHSGDYLLSSSPELFVAVDATGRITTRPIKGTAPLEQSEAALKASLKNRAENLMIVDLMRNDVSRCTLPGSVRVPELYGIDSFTTLRHLSSTIQGQLRPDATIVDVLRATFPPGSMTGAPKLAAMRWIAAHEGQRRGIYSGALGWINGRQCEFSVVIRTLLAQENRFEFQVGGGIVADSTPDSEYLETLTKAKGLAAMLGIASNAL